MQQSKHRSSLPLSSGVVANSPWKNTQKRRGATANLLLTVRFSGNRIQEHLLHALNANSHNWPTAVQNHAAQLLRDNEVSSFPQLLHRVLDDVRRDQQQAAGSSINGAESKEKDKDGKDKSNGEKKGGAVNGASVGEKPSLAIPRAVVDEALKVTMECLREIVTLED
jgi:flagellar hook-basal body complex protein FliE